MASAQLMEEELQHSVVVSDPELDMDVDDDANPDASATKSDRAMEDEEDEEDIDAEGEEDASDRGDGGDEESSDEEVEDAAGDDAFDEDADGEDEDDVHADLDAQAGIPSVEDEDQGRDEDEEEDDDDDDGEGEEDDEGVGAVKIKPGETDAEESDESDASDAADASDVESDGEAAWEEHAEVGGDDEESEPQNQDVCMYCKEDEENDPSDVFESYLSCLGCGENAHQQCARDNNAFPPDTAPETWKCPECLDLESEAAGVDNVETGVEVNGGSMTSSPPATRRATAPKVARDLLPSQRGAVNPDSHSVFNQLVLDEDPMDGSRVLRKRKTSSVEVDESIMSLRKRRKNTADDLDLEDAVDVDDSSRPQSARSSRLKSSSAPLVTVEKKRSRLTLKLFVNPEALGSILSKKPKGQRKEKSEKSRSRPGTARSAVHVGSSAGAPVIATAFSQPFYSFFDKETDELKGKPYGGILNEAEADTSKTLPTNDDRRRFDEAKQKAEEEWRQRVLAMQAEAEVPTRKSKKSSGPASQIECIEFGGCEIDTWYAAPYPEEYSRNRVLFICEFCLKYMNSAYVAWRHKLKCPAKHPPGDEIYRSRSISIFEVDGRKNPVYCQNLCLLAKLFLGSKTLYYDVEPFLFYVLCEYDDLGYHFVGYFSKEKRASSQNNVSCILTLPNHQRKGYGNLLIDFSYLLTKVEKKTGSPEKPLSDMGLVSYRNYWRLIMCRYLLDCVPGDRNEKKGLSIKQISDDTGLTADDVVAALEGLRCLVRDPQTEVYAFRVDLTYCREYVAKWESKKYVTLNPTSLTWTPYVMGRSNASNFELGPALTAIAPREEDEDQKVADMAAAILVNADGPAAIALVNGNTDKPEAEPPEAVIETTEANEVESKKPAVVEEASEAADIGVAILEDAPPPKVSAEHAVEAEAVDKDSVDDWTAPYKDIPVTRFTVFPPLSARRLDRPRPSAPRPLVSRTSSAPQIRRSAGSSRKSSSSRPKSSSSRKKTGGTGRGPGRWPKGTKKSDYGNADSGPGFPPGWVAERVRLPVAGTPKKEDKGHPAEWNLKDKGEDEEGAVQVQTASPKEKRANGVNGVNGVNNAGGKTSPRAADADADAEDEDEDGDGDVDMADADADGDDE